MSIEDRLKRACLDINRASGLVGYQIVKKRFRRDETLRVLEHLRKAQEELQALIAPSERGG